MEEFFYASAAKSSWANTGKPKGPNGVISAGSRPWAWAQQSGAGPWGLGRPTMLPGSVDLPVPPPPAAATPRRRETRERGGGAPPQEGNPIHHPIDPVAAAARRGS